MGNKPYIQRLPIRGGNWNNGANAGVFALNLNNDRANSNTNIGFRAALPFDSKTQTQVFAYSARVKGVYFPSRKYMSGKKIILPRKRLVTAHIRAAEGVTRGGMEGKD